MRSARRVILVLSVAASAALPLTGCMASALPGSGGTATVGASPSVPAGTPAGTPVAGAPSTGVPSTGVPQAATPAITSGGPAPVATLPPSSDPAPAPAVPVNFTFPDGRLSFAHPSGWRIEPEGGLASPSVVNWTVYDHSGNEQVRIFYSDVGGAVSGPLTRTAFYSEPVPGLQGQSGAAAAHASFFVDQIYGEPHYRMALTSGTAFPAGGREAADVVIIGGNRVLAATVTFTGGPFASDEAARTWFAGEEGQALKALLMSFSYR